MTNRVLNSAGISLRQGQFSLLAAAPGVGKSVFATNLALLTQVPTLFFSADSDEWTVKTRGAAILSQQKLTTVEQQLDDPAWTDYLSGFLRKGDHVDWCFRTDLDMEFIPHRMNAHAEVFGEYPQLVVVDNLGNAVGDAPDEFAELRRICRDLQSIARGTRAHVMGLHHVVGGREGKKEGGFEPIGLGDLIGKIGKIPEVVLGMCHSGEDRILLTVPKNRGGKGNLSLYLDIDYTTATIGGYR